MDVRLIYNLSNQKIGDICARNYTDSKLRCLGEDFVMIGPPSTGQSSRPRDRPIKFTVLDQLFLQTLIVISAPEDDLKRQALKATDACAAIASSKSS